MARRQEEQEHRGRKQGMQRQEEQWLRGRKSNGTDGGRAKAGRARAQKQEEQRHRGRKSKGTEAGRAKTQRQEKQGYIHRQEEQDMERQEDQDYRDIATTIGWGSTSAIGEKVYGNRLKKTDLRLVDPKECSKNWFNLFQTARSQRKSDFLNDSRFKKSLFAENEHPNTSSTSDFWSLLAPSTGSRFLIRHSLPQERSLSAHTDISNHHAWLNYAFSFPPAAEDQRKYYPDLPSSLPLADLPIAVLLFADDAALVASSAERLQALIDAIAEYASRNSLFMSQLELLRTTKKILSRFYLCHRRNLQNQESSFHTALLEHFEQSPLLLQTLTVTCDENSILEYSIIRLRSTISPITDCYQPSRGSPPEYIACPWYLFRSNP
ncbi:unnamed protein product [Cyprideis torosa]|uniref:Uncharacterized protein n=1 Tax=Cyprideis torosa TaxID=163714 RepID=A0A7R8WGT2_9CRUS|nr:unnamed protein product [Cyprideis torosa]CAG0892112.1 unnamed protein product [Cyprideis torosa]